MCNCDGIFEFLHEFYSMKGLCIKTLVMNNEEDIQIIWNKNLVFKYPVLVLGYGHFQTIKQNYQIFFTTKSIGIWQKKGLVYFNTYWSTFEMAALLKEGFDQCIQG